MVGCVYMLRSERRKKENVEEKENVQLAQVHYMHTYTLSEMYVPKGFKNHGCFLRCNMRKEIFKSITPFTRSGLSTASCRPTRPPTELQIK